MSTRERVEPPVPQSRISGSPRDTLLPDSAEDVSTIAEIAHDLNNLLGAIRGYAELTMLAAPPGDEVRAFSAKVIDATDRAKALTHRLLSFAERREDELSPR